MQFTLIILTVLITMVTTTVTFYKMTTMKKRIKASERALCIAAALISVGFLLEAITQVKLSANLRLDTHNIERIKNGLLN